jgi:hypothetical protein
MEMFLSVAISKELGWSKMPICFAMAAAVI